MKFGENLKHLRKVNKMSQEKLAEKVGVSRQSVSKWETGESYPEMSNILALCSIFRCTINHLVNDNIIDSNLLDDEIKMSVVKFKEKEQKKMKGLSKAIYVIARILKSIVIVGAVASLICIIGTIIMIPNTDIDTSNNILKISDNEYKYELSDSEFRIYDNEKEYDIALNNEFPFSEVLYSSKSYKMTFFLTIFISLAGFLSLIFKELSYLEKLFINIHNEETPFNFVNVGYVKKMAIYTAIIVIFPDLFGLILGFIYGLSITVTIEVMSYVYVLIIFALSYIFKYGYEIQLDSKSKIYGDIDL